MRIALYSSEASSPRFPPAIHSTRIEGLARMLRLLGHDCVLVRRGRADNGGGMVREDSAAGTRVVHLLTSPGTASGVAAAAFLDEERPDVLWLLQPQGASELVEAVRGRSMGVVADMHGLLCGAGEGSRPHDGPAAEVDARNLRVVLERADAVVARLPWERATALREGADPGRIADLPFGAVYGLGRIDPSAGGAVVLRFAGPLNPDAGALELLEALALRDLPVRVQICGWPAGDPTYEERLTELAAADPRVTFADVPEGGFDALVVPSLRPACPVGSLEALVAGCAVLVSDASGLAQLTGVGASQTFRSGDPEALAALLERIAQPGAVAGVRPVPLPVPGIEEEALVMERVARLVTEPPPPAQAYGWRSPTRLVGGGIDMPHDRAAIPRTAVQLTGWAVCEPQPVSRVEVEVDGRAVGRARIGLARPVQLDEFSAPEVAVCGFEHWIDLTTLPETTSRIRFSVDVLAVDGSRFPLSPIDVSVEPGARAASADAERAAVLQERLHRMVRTSRRRRKSTEDVRMVAVGHSLGYGGAQLYLFELLRRLAREPWFSCTVVSPTDGPLREAYESLGIAVHVSGFPQVNDVDAYEGRQLEIGSWLEGESCNIVLGNTLMAFPWIDLAARLGIPTLWPIHESYHLSEFWGIHLPPDGIHPVVQQRVEAALRSAGALIFVADATRCLYEPFADARRLVKVDYGLDLEEVARYRASFDRRAVRARLGIPQHAKVVLCLGAVEPRKSQTMLAQAFAVIAGSYPDAFLTLVGDAGGDYSEALREYLDRAGLASRSRVVPVVEDTHQWYGVADLFVLPSDVESLPRSVLEAMAFGVPVAATSAYGVPELVQDGVTGYLCEPRDLKALSQLLGRLLAEDPAILREVGEAGARLVAQRHDGAGYADAYGRLARALVGNPDAFPGDVLDAAEAPAAGTVPEVRA